MKSPLSFLPVALGVALTLPLAAPVLAQEGRAHGEHMAPKIMHGPAITVSGTGDAQLAPELATVTLGVLTQAEKAADAMSQNSAALDQVMQVFTAAGVEARDMQTSGLSLNVQYEYPENRRPVTVGYEARNGLMVRVRDLDSLGGLLDQAITAGANQVEGISFGADNTDAALDQARQNAVKDAMHRAQIMAETSGMRLGPVLSISETGGMPERPQPMMARMAADGAAQSAVPIAAGELTLSANVQMRFALLPLDGQGDGQPPLIPAPTDAARTAPEAAAEPAPDVSN
ncbi:MAG: SIMPL domain-containing protein [Paracoccus sp. (in: a-proteobacteria)]|uniref:SIMPL domain-containing protein n=1 Tax=Paracoccus sp. TaxID=267 RepID=UPI0026E039C4|nr:SIMPL domain-containing protein [Paracoccus sp. (in: a-proteobacteria)]MDO5621610.1 SIMPL domain-containing protein [Paracoccus sp. (in: a-proteobacteria)]